MNKNFAIPIAGPSANENTRAFQYRRFFEINRNTKIETKQRVNRAIILDFFMHFSAFLFILITLLLFTVFNNDNTLEIDKQATGEDMVLLGVTSICQSGEFSLTNSVNEFLRPNCISKNSSQTNKPDKNRPRQETVEQQVPGRDPSQRPFFQ